MSTYVELETRCKRRLGRRGMTITTEFLDEMLSAQEKLEKSGALPKWLKTTSGDEVTLATNTILTNLPPSDFIKVYDDQALAYYAEDGLTEKRAIRLDTRNQLVSKKNAGISGEIFWYLASRTEIEIAPALGRDTTFFLSYYAKETVLTGGNDNQWCTEEGELIMGMAGVELAIWLRDDRALQYYQNLAATERRRMVNQVEADEWGDTDLTMGGPD
jgi:hypothetical protein